MTEDHTIDDRSIANRRLNVANAFLSPGDASPSELGKLLALAVMNLAGNGIAADEPDKGDRLLTLDEASALLGLEPKRLKRRHAEFPFSKCSSRKSSSPRSASAAGLGGNRDHHRQAEARAGPLVACRR